jgi:predicted transcriptional regulator
MADRTIPIRLDESTIQRLDQLAEALTTRAQGAKVSRTAAMRVAVERGLDVLEAELDVPKPKRRKR